MDAGVAHTCGTAHCIAGWVTELGNPGVRALELIWDTETAADTVYEYTPGSIKPSFYPANDRNTEASNRAALKELKKLVEMEKANA